MLDKLRQQIAKVDDQILELISSRQNLAKEIAKYKLQHDLPIKDFRVEKNVIEKNRKHASDLGLTAQMAEELSKLLIKYAVLVQDEFHKKSKSYRKGQKEKILIIGGLGGMGQWLCQFFSSFGHQVAIFDINRAAENIVRFPIVHDFDKGVQQHSVIILSTPISSTATVIDRIAAVGTKALVFDICSLKTPLYNSIDRAGKAGIKITSCHPMFGPGVELLADRNILFCTMHDDDRAAEQAQSLFGDTTARLIMIPLKQHDQYIGNILGLSHLVNLVYARALANSGFKFAELEKIGSTTFNAQNLVCADVVRENQDLYYEIQAENATSAAIFKLLYQAWDEFRKAVTEKDRIAFKRLMSECRDFF